MPPKSKGVWATGSPEKTRNAAPQAGARSDRMNRINDRRKLARCFAVPDRRSEDACHSWTFFFTSSVSISSSKGGNRIVTRLLVRLYGGTYLYVDASRLNQNDPEAKR